MRRSFLLVGVALLSLGATAFAQFPPNTTFVSAHGGTFDPDGLLGIGPRGAPTTFLPFPNTFFKMVEMNPKNDGLMLQTVNGIHHFDLKTGNTTFATLNGNLAGMTVDEDAGMAWLQNASLYRSSTTLGTNPVFLATVVAGGARGPHGPCWNGTTGGYVSCSYGIPSNLIGVMQFFDRAGVLTRTVGGFSYITDYTWSPWSGDILVTYRLSGALLRVSQNGVISTIAPVPVAPWALKVPHQNAANVEQALVCRMAPANIRGPHDILRVTGAGAVTTLITGSIVPREVEVLGSRPLWATGAWRAGALGRLNLNMGAAFAGHAYRVALSLSHAPGLNLGTVHLHLVPDRLFALTANGDVPGLTRGFAGQLDAFGRASVPPEVSIPSGLRGLRVFAGGVTFNLSGITGATNCWGITIQ